MHPPFDIAKNCLKDVNLLTISKDDKFLRFQKADMRNICTRILEDIKFMAEHNLMDYSLLLITEKNPDFIDDSSNGSACDKNSQIKSNDAGHPTGIMLLKKHPSAVLEA